MKKLDGMKEAKKIITFLKQVFRTSGKDNVVIGWSGGIDSTVSLYLLAKALPFSKIHAIHMPYSTSYASDFSSITSSSIGLNNDNLKIVSIRDTVDRLGKELNATSDRVRMGNLMARVRMITLFDYAKETDGLVCGTENKSEHLLGYYTRYGDGASDIEPIQHLYKTQIFDLAKHLGVPENIFLKKPSANLWESQTDEGEFGFSYKEADEVLYLYFDKKESLKRIISSGYKNAKRIIDFANKNAFKHQVPYVI